MASLDEAMGCIITVAAVTAVRGYEILSMVCIVIKKVWCLRYLFMSPLQIETRCGSYRMVSNGRVLLLPRCGVYQSMAVAV